MAVANAVESCHESEGYVVFLERLLTAGVRECDLFGSAAFVRRHLRRLCTPPPPATAAAAAAAAAAATAAAAERTSRPTSPSAPSPSSAGLDASRGALRLVAPLRELLHALRQFERAQVAQVAAAAAAVAAAATAPAEAAGEAPQGAAAEASGAATAAEAPAVAAVALAAPPVLLELNLIVPAEDAGSWPHGTRGGEGDGGGRMEGAPTDIVAYEAGQEWMVEAILEQRVGGAGEIEYLVKWQQWTEEHNTWEPEANLGGCVELLSAFHASVASGVPSSSGAPVTSADGGAAAAAAAGGGAEVAGNQDGPSAALNSSALSSSATLQRDGLQPAPAAEKTEGGSTAQAEAAVVAGGVSEGSQPPAVPSGGGGEEAAVEAAAEADREENVKVEIGEEQQPGSMLLGGEGEGRGDGDGDGVGGGDQGEEDEAEAEAEAAARLVLELPPQLGNPSEVPHAAAARSIGRRGGRGARGRGRGRTPPPATDLQYVLVGVDLVMCGVAGWAARAEELARGPEPPDVVASGGGSGYGGGGFGGGYGSGSYGGSSNDGPDAERRRLVEAAAAGYDPDQCERNSECTRGFKHRGFGGHCRLPAGASKPSKKGARHATLQRLRHADALLPCDEATPDDDLWRKRRSSTKRVSWAPLPPPRTPPSSPPPGEEGEEEGEGVGEEYELYDSGTDGAAAAGATGGAAAAGYTSQCERNPECKRGFRHGGWGGRCSFTSSGGSGRRKRRGGASQIAASAEYDRVQAIEESEATARALARGQDGALEEGEEAEEAVMDEAAMEVDEAEGVANGSGAAAAVAAAAGGAASAGLVAQAAVPMEVQVGMPSTGVAEAVQRGAALPPSKPSLPPPSQVSAGEIAPGAAEIVQAEPLFDLPPELVVPVRMGEQPPGEQQPPGAAAAAAAAVGGRGLDCQG